MVAAACTAADTAAACSAVDTAGACTPPHPHRSHAFPVDFVRFFGKILVGRYGSGAAGGMYGGGMRGGIYSQGMMGQGLPYTGQQPGAHGMSPFQGVMSVLGIVGGIAQFADAALEAVHVFLSLSARLCDRLGWARQELSGAVAAAAAAAAAARAARASTSSRTSANLRRLLICAAVSGRDV
jgi:hypothetical protein